MVNYGVIYALFVVDKYAWDFYGAYQLYSILIEALLTRNPMVYDASNFSEV